MPKSARMGNSHPLQEWAHQPGNLGGTQSPRRGQKGGWWGQKRSHVLLAFVKAQAGLLLPPPPSIVVVFQDPATQPLASLPQAPKIPLSGLQHGTTALLQCSQFQLPNPCLWAGSSPSVPNPDSDLGTPRSLGSHRAWNCWTDRAGRKMGHHGKGDRCHVYLALDMGVELTCNRQNK